MSWMDPIDCAAIDTPTVIERRRLREERASKYIFVLESKALVESRALGDSAVLAYAAIRAAAFGDRSGDWVTVGRITRELFRRSYKWWYRATESLADAGLIEIDRRRGQLPRYRLLRRVSDAG
jgi:hypothetical protein